MIGFALDVDGGEELTFAIEEPLLLLGLLSALAGEDSECRFAADGSL